MLYTLIDVVLPVFLVIGAGYSLTATRVLSESHVEGLLKFSQGFAIPCMLFSAIARVDLAESFDPGLLAAFYAGAAICFVLGMTGARILFSRDWEDCVVIGFCCLFSNSVLLGLAVTERAFGAASLAGTYAIVAFHVPFCYGLGVAAMEFVRNRNRRGFAFVRAVWRSIYRNFLLLAITLGFAVNLSGLQIPVTFDTTLSLISRAALPTALCALGGVLVRYRPDGDARMIAFVCAISLVLHPALVWGFGRAVSLNIDLFRSAVLTSAMAPGMNAYIFANIYGRAKRVAASSVLVATVASILTVWCWLGLLG